MGATLATAAITMWPNLPDHARLALVTMCLQARDKSSHNTPAGLYYGGHEDLASRLYGVDQPTEADLQRVKRSIRALREAGAVIVAQPACRGRTAVYRLEVTGIPGQDQLL